MNNEYNSESSSVEDIFNKLIKFAQALNEEEKRYIKEELESEEELAVFDILIRPQLTIYTHKY